MADRPDSAETNTRRTMAEVMAELGTDTPLNRARKVFSSWCAKIEQAGQQREPLSPVEMRRMEFEAVEAIGRELGRPDTEISQDAARDDLVAALTEDTQLRASAIQAVADVLEGHAGRSTMTDEELFETAAEYYDAAAGVLNAALSRFRGAPTPRSALADALRREIERQGNPAPAYIDFDALARAALGQDAAREMLAALGSMPCYGCSVPCGDNSPDAIRSARGCFTCRAARKAIAKATRGAP